MCWASIIRQVLHEFSVVRAIPRLTKETKANLLPKSIDLSSWSANGIQPTTRSKVWEWHTTDLPNIARLYRWLQALRSARLKNASRPFRRADLRAEKRSISAGRCVTSSAAATSGASDSNCHLVNQIPICPWALRFMNSQETAFFSIIRVAVVQLTEITRNRQLTTREATNPPQRLPARGARTTPRILGVAKPVGET